MKALIKYLLLIPVLTILHSCKLEVVPPNDVTTANFLKTNTELEAGLLGCYDALQGVGQYGQQLIWAPEAMSDNANSANNDVFEFVNFTFISSTGRVVAGSWGDLYRSITRSNTILQSIDAVTMEANRKNQIKGEALALRAMAYFNLVRLFGGVPLLTKPAGSLEQTKIARSSVEEVYAFILDDLTKAENLVTAVPYSDASSLNKARMTKGAVNTLQAHVYLTTRQWDQASKYSQAVLTNPLYQFSTSYTNIFPAKLKAESVFEVQFAGTLDGGFGLPDLLLPNPPATYNFPKFVIPTVKFDTLMKSSDGRRTAYMTHVTGSTEDTPAPVNPASPGNMEGNTDLFPYKWVSTNAFASADNVYVYRYSDVMLMRAEALNELGYPNADAFTLLNKIRTRAGLPAYTATQLPTSAAFRNEVARQRQLELCFEGKRWFDLKRYYEYNKVDPSAGYTFTALDQIEARTKTRNENLLILPLPRNELFYNPAAIQNPGY